VAVEGGSYSFGGRRRGLGAVQLRNRRRHGRSSPKGAVGGGIFVSFATRLAAHWPLEVDVRHGDEGGGVEVLRRAVFTWRRETAKGGARVAIDSLKGYRDGERREGALVLARCHTAGAIGGMRVATGDRGRWEADIDSGAAGTGSVGRRAVRHQSRGGGAANKWGHTVIVPAGLN
jgi:hypothetical protein